MDAVGCFTFEEKKTDCFCSLCKSCEETAFVIWNPHSFSVEFVSNTNKINSQTLGRCCSLKNFGVDKFGPSLLYPIPHYIHFDQVSSIPIQLHPVFSIVIHIIPFLSNSIHFIHFCVFQSIWSNFITFIHFHLSTQAVDSRAIRKLLDTPFMKYLTWC